MKNNFDLFEFANKLVDELRNLGENDLAQKIEAALYISTVPGEILGQLRIELRELVRSAVMSGLPIHDQILEAVKYLDDVLG